jgi:hypothetical protein
MLQVYKYRLPQVTGVTEVLMPKDADVISTELQDGELVLWALVDVAKENEIRFFRTILTGEEVPRKDVIRFIGTVLSHNGKYVQHVFESMPNR